MIPLPVRLPRTAALVVVAALCTLAGAASVAADTPIDAFTTPQGPVSNFASGNAVVKLL